MRQKGSHLAAALAWVGYFVATAGAQPRPMPPDPYDPQQNAPSATVSSPTASTSAGQSSATNVTDFPAAEVRAVPIAMAQAAHDRAEFDRAEINVRLVVDQLKEDFQYSSQVLTAMRGQQLAYDRYTAARDRVLDQLAGQTDYQTLQHLRDELTKTLDQLHADSVRNHDRIIATASVKMQYACKISQMESDALQADAAVQNAKAQFIDASNRLSDMRAEFARSIRRDSTFVAAKNQLEDARVERDTSLAFLAGAVEARNIAMNYAYDLHRWDQYKYLSAGGIDYGYPYSYGYGAGYGYVTPSVVYNPYNYYRRW